jgi:hypothetical protein
VRVTNEGFGETKERDLYHADKLQRTTKILCFSRFFSIETHLSRDSKLQVRQGGDDGAFNVFDQAVEADLSEL